MRLVSLLFILATPGWVIPVHAQDAPVDLRTWKPSRPEPIVMMQVWGTYTPRTRTFSGGPFPRYHSQHSIWNTQVRRARVGLKGEILPRLHYTAILAFDQIGHDALAGTTGGANNGAFPGVGILDAFVTWGIRRDGKGIHLTAGYFRPQYGRESITSGFAVNSIEKTMDQNYLREHMVYSNPGRAAGINAGCQMRLGSDKAWLRWDAGLFNPDQGYPGNFPLLGVGRIAGTWGDPESEGYSLSHRINYFGKRQGLTVGVGGSLGRGQAFYVRSWTYGLDLLWNHGPFQLDGEIHWLGRDILPSGGDPIFNGDQYVSRTGHLRAGVNISLDHLGHLEPTVAWAFFYGGMSENDQGLAVGAQAPAGREFYFEPGVNWWFNARTVLQLHYTFRQGQAGHAGDGAEVNSYFTQSGLGAIRRGDWAGLALRWML
ncbi:MAG: hypothetical protein H6568_16615 [Lewinellaceae bacterium]|nr:hypothetical protein [Saprospiraceae bacterium]MCB9314379.1 hypothetical protein [Lewinellaceae bacterium]